MSILITTKELIKSTTPNSLPELSSEQKLRELYIYGDIFKMGEIVTSGEVTGEIIHRGTNYVTVISEGTEHKFWLKEIKIEKDVCLSEKNREQIHKDSFVYKGYKTLNFTRGLSENFVEISNIVEDKYAFLNYIKSLDTVLGFTTEYITEKYAVAKIETERVRKYAKKIGQEDLSEQVVSAVEEDMFKYAILEGINFTTTDRIMVARVIASVASINNPSGIDPVNVINQAVIKLRMSHLTTPGWKMLGKMLNVATVAGIRWNKDIITPSIQKVMELK